MAIILYKNADKTVSNIAERNAIAAKIDNMVVTVVDAIADVAAGTGVATYKWNAALNRWLLISKSSIDTMSFETVELTISDGKVTPPNVPVNNVLWDIFVMDGDIIAQELRLSDIIVSPVLISGLGVYDGKKLRFTYAYGAITQQIEQQIETYMDSKIAAIIDFAPEDLDTLKEISDRISSIETSIGGTSSSTGTVEDFEEELI
jgi:hypothetical protein